MTAVIKIKMDNDAFKENGKQELARILKDLADFCEYCLNLEAVGGLRTILDINGNSCGTFALK
jgi:hypothetical protein